MIKVKTIKRHNKSTLVEFLNQDGILERRFIPSAEETVTEVTNELLDMGIVYGDSFDFTDAVIKGADLKRELNRRGIWKIDDIKNNPDIVNAAIRYISQMTTRSVILEAIRCEEDEEETNYGR